MNCARDATAIGATPTRFTDKAIAVRHILQHRLVNTVAHSGHRARRVTLRPLRESFSCAVSEMAMICIAMEVKPPQNQPRCTGHGYSQT
jgi:hypothetical protein